MTDNNSNTHPPPTPTNDDRPWPALTIDYQFYERMLEESDVSDEEKKAFIEVWWNLIVNFADLGFEIHPLQQACEQPLDLSTLDIPDMLSLKILELNKEFVKTTKNQKGDI